MSVAREVGHVLHVDAETVERHVTPAVARRAAERAATLQESDSTEVRRLTLPVPGGWMRVLAAAVPDAGVFGYKEFHLSGAGAVRYAVHLFEAESGRPLGIVDGALLTPLRTAGAAATAARAYFDNSHAGLVVGIVGSSTEAKAGLRALHEALDVERCIVTSRRGSSREAFAEVMGAELDLDVEAAPDVPTVAAKADLVYVATASAGEIVVRDADLDGLRLLLSIGSTLPAQRELEGAVLSNSAAVIVDTLEVLEESGDALAAAPDLDLGCVSRLGQFLARPTRPEGRTIYKSIGSPEQDVVLASAVLELAREVGFGRQISPLSGVKWNG